ncbi:MAG: TRAP transporter small permease [Candidatus Accumulibacter sp.]|nr:TRAP transporter small permease [Accumulibacter sp.]
MEQLLGETIMGKIKAILHFLDDRLEESILSMLLLLITLLTGTQIIMRYVLLSPLSWSEELCRYCYMWTGFISVAYCIRKRIPIRINTLVMLLPHRKQKMLEVFTNAISTVLYSAFFLSTITIIEKTIITRQASPAMRLPFYIIYIGPFLGFGLSLLRLIQVIAQDARDVLSRTGDGPEELPQVREAIEYIRENRRGG